MTDYTPCHRPSDRYDFESILEADRWSPDCDSDSSDSLEDWLIDDLSDRAQIYEQTQLPEAELSAVPFPELLKVAAQVAQAAADDF